MQMQEMRNKQKELQMLEQQPRLQGWEQKRCERKEDRQMEHQEMQLWIVRMVSSVLQSSSSRSSAIISCHAKIGVTFCRALFDATQSHILQHLVS